jgi:hypothetical protein
MHFKEHDNKENSTHQLLCDASGRLDGDAAAVALHARRQRVAEPLQCEVSQQARVAIEALRRERWHVRNPAHVLLVREPLLGERDRRGRLQRALGGRGASGQHTHLERVRCRGRSRGFA